jgi:glycerol-3-phosphate dehydrogenase
LTEAGTNYDLLIIGGGINGTGIARDAAGRGLSVLLVEKDDLASATSSWSSKLIHGGLRYLEQFQFRLVAEALAEREVLLDIAPHLVKPLRFVMPHVPQLRPRWMIRAGLFLYDHMGHRAATLGTNQHRLPKSHGISLRTQPYNAGLKPEFTRGFIYSDCRVDDARLVLANAISAAEAGAAILTRTECIEGKRGAGGWQISLQQSGGKKLTVTAGAIINAAGPWVKQVLNDRLRQTGHDSVRLVKGSHIVLNRLYEGDHAYILQNDDRRVVFMIPFLDHYTLVGTTDLAITELPTTPAASNDEIEYLCRAINRYLQQPVSPTEIVWSYAGVRPLYDDGAQNPSAVTRDYTLCLDDDNGAAPILSVYGGKITTYRKLAEHALGKLKPYFKHMREPWTASTPLPGAEAVDTNPDAPWQKLPPALLNTLRNRHGTRIAHLLVDVKTTGDMGIHFGANLYAREVDYMINHEWAVTTDDILYRRSKAGLQLTPAQREAVAAYVEAPNPASD